MKILMLSTDTGLYKEESDVRRRMRAYGAFVDEIVVLVPIEGKNFSVILEGPVKIIPIQKTNRVMTFFKILSVGLSLGASLKTRSDVVISSQDPFELGLIAFLISRRYRFPLHFQVHIDFFSPFFKKETLRNRMQYFLARFLLPKANAIRVVSQKIYTYVQSLGISEHRITNAPIARDVVSIADVQPSKHFLETYAAWHPKILCASRLVRQKNLPLTVNVFERIQKEYPSAVLVVVGSGPQEKILKTIVAKRGLEKNVLFEGWTDTLPSYMKAADLFLLTSDYEGWGMTVVEACAAGTPVVMTDVGCAGEFLVDGKNGMVAPVRDVDALAEKILRLLRDQTLYDAIKKRAQESIAALPSEEAYQKVIVQSWRSALGKYTEA